MALAFTRASAQYLSSSSGVPALDTVSAVVAVRLPDAVNPYNDVGGVFSIRNGSGGYFDLNVADIDGFKDIRLEVDGAADVINFETTTTYDGQWVIAAITRSGGTIRMRIRRPEDSIWLADVNRTDANATPDTGTTIELGRERNLRHHDEPIGFLKVWDAVLSEGELWAETHTIRPIRTANLNRWTPLNASTLTNSLIDYGGSAHDWSQTNSPAVSDGPAIAWGGASQIVASGDGDIALTVQNATHAHATDSPSLTQANTLAVNGASHAHSAGSPSLAQENTLAVNGATHGHSAASPSLTQANILAVNGATHAHSAQTPTLTEANVLAAQNALHSHLADSPSLVQANILAVANGLHAHTATNLDLISGNSLSVNSADHAHQADNVLLVQANVLVVNSATHSHSAQSITLTQSNILAVANALHAHSPSSPTLSVDGATLAVAAALHLHSAGHVELTQSSTLIVSNTLHAHIASSLNLVLPGEGLDPSLLFIIAGDDSVFVVAPEGPGIFIVN